MSCNDGSVSRDVSKLQKAKDGGHSGLACLVKMLVLHAARQNKVAAVARAGEFGGLEDRLHTISVKRAEIRPEGADLDDGEDDGGVDHDRPLSSCAKVRAGVATAQAQGELGR